MGLLGESLSSLFYLVFLFLTSGFQKPMQKVLGVS